MMLIPGELGKDTHRKQSFANFAAEEKVYFTQVVAFVFEYSLGREDFKGSHSWVS